MQFSVALLLAASASAAATGLQDQNLGFVKFEVDKSVGDSFEESTQDTAISFVKRDGVNMSLNNQRTYYEANLLIGSNNQSNRVLVDTGSSDLWVPSSNVSCRLTSSGYASSRAEALLGVSKPRVIDLDDLIHSKDQQTRTVDLDKRATSLLLLNSAVASATGSSSSGNQCTAFGSFDYSLSSSFNLNLTAPRFSIVYADGTASTGFWGTDTVQFGGTSIPNLSFAIANVTSSQTGVLGIGLAGLEATNLGRTFPYYTYENLPMRLKSLGLIQTNAYSLYLNKRTATKGSVLFGAVDHAKYSGTLQSVPMIKGASSTLNAPLRLQVVMNGILIQGGSQNVVVTNTPISALLDSGSTYSFLPQAMISELATALSAELNQRYGLYQVSCNYLNSNYNITFSFSGIDIAVPMSEMVASSMSMCFLTLLPLDMDLYSAPAAILGDNFLRSIYAVYDLDNYQIAMAPAVYTTAENIEVISSTIPLASQAPGYSSTSTAASVTDLTSAATSLSAPRKGAASHQYSVSSSLWAAVGCFMSVFLL